MASYKTIYDQYLEYKAKKGIREMSKESLHWFYDNVRQIRGDFVQASRYGRVKTTPEPGKIYLYQYDPKTKERMPFYDTVPLVLITDVTPDGWYGVNFHYMPPKVRLAVMETLYKNIKDDTKTDKVKFLMNWQIASRVAKAASATEYLNESIKQYLGSHLRSRLVEIDPEYWAMIMFLPLGRFKKGGKR